MRPAVRLSYLAAAAGTITSLGELLFLNVAQLIVALNGDYMGQTNDGFIDPHKYIYFGVERAKQMPDPSGVVTAHLHG